MRTRRAELNFTLRDTVRKGRLSWSGNVRQNVRGETFARERSQDATGDRTVAWERSRGAMGDIIVARERSRGAMGERIVARERSRGATFRATVHMHKNPLHNSKYIDLVIIAGHVDPFTFNIVVVNFFPVVLMLPIASTVWVNCQQISEVHILYSMILYLLLYTHLRVTESWRGHVSTIIWGVTVS